MIQQTRGQTSIPAKWIIPLAVVVVVLVGSAVAFHEMRNPRNKAASVANRNSSLSNGSASNVATLSTDDWKHFEKEGWEITFMYPSDFERFRESMDVVILTQIQNLNSGVGFPALVIERIKRDNPQFNEFVAAQKTRTEDYNGLNGRQFDLPLSTYTVFVLDDYQYSIQLSHRKPYEEIYYTLLRTIKMVDGLPLPEPISGRRTLTLCVPPRRTGELSCG